MAGRIFINYRREDDPGFAQLLYVHLEGEFGAARLFMDIEGHIKLGDDVAKAQSAASKAIAASRNQESYVAGGPPIEQAGWG